MHVTDWLPTFVSAAGGHLTELGTRFGGLDGISQWEALSALGRNPGRDRAASARPYDGVYPRSEILHNIEGVGGQGVAVRSLSVIAQSAAP